MIRLNDITSKLLSYHSKADTGLVEKAYVYSAKVHQGQVRLSGETYLSHPLEVAYLLALMKMDVISIVAGLLHDTLEDTDAELSEIERLFGMETASIVDGVTKISKIKFMSYEERQAENMRKMLLAMATDIRVIMVKLADRLHNMRTLGFQTPEKQKLISEETLGIYAPLAGRMGIYWLKSGLEDLCLYYLESAIYREIKTGISGRREARETVINESKELISKKLKDAGINATIRGRQKHLYGIYKKTIDQNLTANQVFDILALRIIVDSLKKCYEVLGLIHSTWKPIPGRFKDFISMPKENMYQSLHTTVIGPSGLRMEIQIRTWEMEQVAEEGIAAHWKYKEGQGAKKADEKQFSWLRQLLEWQQNLKDPKEFIDTIRMDLFPNEVYVFTPKGEVKEFPKGATPIDFAYSIHSEVGEKCVGARINGKMSPLKYQLQNGDIVEIIRSGKQHPHKDWLNFVKTSRAKTKIRQWIKTQERDENINMGKEMLEKGLDQSQLTLPDIMKSEQLSAITKALSFHSVQDLIAGIGYGEISVNQVIGRLKPKLEIAGEKPTGLVGKVVSKIMRKQTAHGIKIRGLSNMLVRFAKCCNPLPGEHVIGFITRGRGVTIHKYECRYIVDTDPERIVEVEWNPTDKDIHIARLKVTALDKKGVLAEISAIISRNETNILQADIKTTIDKKGISLFTLEVKNYTQLENIMGAVKKLKDVLLVERL